MKRILIALAAVILVAMPAYLFTAQDNEIKKLKQVVSDTSYKNYWGRLKAIKKLGKIGNLESTKILAELLGDKETTLCNECECNEKENTNTKKISNLDDVNNGCDSLQSCLEQLFEKKDLISLRDFKQCLEKGGNKNTKKWGCNNCPDTIDRMPSPNKQNPEEGFFSWCIKNCGTKVVN